MTEAEIEEIIEEADVDKGRSDRLCRVLQHDEQNLFVYFL